MILDLAVCQVSRTMTSLSTTHVSPRRVSSARTTSRRRLLVASPLSTLVLVEKRRADAASGTFCAPGVQVDGGIVYCDAVVGDGDAPKRGDVIRCHYRGRLASNDAVFDASYDRNKPLRFTVGVGQVIAGWDMALLGQDAMPAMKAGGKRTVLVPAALAYGERGAGGGIIPPNADLVFDIELLGKQ